MFVATSRAPSRSPSLRAHRQLHVAARLDTLSPVAATLGSSGETDVVLVDDNNQMEVRWAVGCQGLPWSHKVLGGSYPYYAPVASALQQGSWTDLFAINDSALYTEAWGIPTSWNGPVNIP